MNKNQLKILIVVAQHNFRDEEFDIPNRYFLKNNILVNIVSENKGECIGKLGMRITAQKSFDDVLKTGIIEYNAIMLVGGSGSVKFVSNMLLEKIIHQFKEQNKLITAICYAPVILAKSGVLKRKRATVWNNDCMQEPILKECGAIFVDKPVVIDQLLITGNGPGAAEEFAKAVVKELNK